MISPFFYNSVVYILISKSQLINNCRPKTKQFTKCCLFISFKINKDIELIRRKILHDLPKWDYWYLKVKISNQFLKYKKFLIFFHKCLADWSAEQRCWSWEQEIEGGSSDNAATTGVCRGGGGENTNGRTTKMIEINLVMLMCCLIDSNYYYIGLNSFLDSFRLSCWMMFNSLINNIFFIILVNFYRAVLITNLQLRPSQLLNVQLIGFSLFIYSFICFFFIIPITSQSWWWEIQIEVG